MRIKGKIPLIYGVPEESFFRGFKAAQAFVAELRPGLEGDRVVAAALLKKGVVPVIICDNMMAFCMNQGLVKEVHIFCQSFSRKTCLCRTGSLIAALSAKFHKIPAYLSRAKVPFLKTPPLQEICGKRVTLKHIPAYVPLLEEVPMDLVKQARLCG